VLRWWVTAAVLARLQLVDGLRGARAPVDGDRGCPVTDTGRSASSARRTVGATSMSWPNGARPVLAEVSHPRP
jgi:hypothetical protein